MQYIRNAPHARGRDGGRHHVAAHAEDHVRTKPVDEMQGAAERQRDERRQGQVLPRRVAVQPPHADSLQVEAGGRNSSLLRAALAPDQQNGTARLVSAERSRDRERRIQVPAGTAARDQKSHLTDDCSATPNPSRGGRC